MQLIQKEEVLVSSVIKDRNLYASKCKCGAVTITNEENSFSNSMSRATFRRLFVRNNFQNENFNVVRFKFVWMENTCYCNHCKNNMGIDLCGCGSGKRKGRCREGHLECYNSIPSQELFLIECIEEDCIIDIF